jgi:hypothetical protein
MFSREVLAARFGVALTMEKYGTVCNVFRIATRRYSRPECTSTPIRAFMFSFKKGTKNFRKTIEFREKELNLAASAQVLTFLRTTETVEPTKQRLRSLFSNWNLYYINSSIKVFIFKYYNNILGLNSRVSHFNREVDASCTFCTLRHALPAPKETLVHLFYHCPTTNDILGKFYGKYLHGIILEQSTFFLSNASDKEFDNKPLNIVLDVLRYVIWQHKLNKKIPSFSLFESEFHYLIGSITGASKNFEMSLTNCRFFQRERRVDHGELRRP